MSLKKGETVIIYDDGSGDAIERIEDAEHARLKVEVVMGIGRGAADGYNGSGWNHNFVLDGLAREQAAAQADIEQAAA